MKLLLHTCCAPCVIYPLKVLREKNFEVEAFFYNPNIYPCAEYNARRQAVEQYAQEVTVLLNAPEYAPQEFLRAIEHDLEKPQRCFACWKMRLVKTALEARKRGAGYFSSTLLVSPYQNQEALKELGEQAAAEAGVKFYYEDFRPGFRKTHEEAKAKGIYCQKYCGCLYSMKPRLTKRKCS